MIRQPEFLLGVVLGIITVSMFVRDKRRRAQAPALRIMIERDGSAWYEWSIYEVESGNRVAKSGGAFFWEQKLAARRRLRQLQRNHYTKYKEYEQPNLRYVYQSADPNDKAAKKTARKAERRLRSIERELTEGQQ